MSFRLKGLLSDQYQSQVEHSYLGAMNALVFENVPCEMVFESSSGFMEHESAKHNYLPVFHLMGSITEIRGDFPYHVSSLYFNENERAAMSRDILYYPTPDELAYMIQSGKFYSKHFEIPMVLNHNTYTFPAVVNLTVIPPEDEMAYEQAFSDSSEKSGTLDSDTVDKTNLPIIYVGIAGTGVSRKTDKLLDYYGIEMDQDYPSFVLTAESSGYTDPPLLKYIPEPEMESEHQQLNHGDYYFTEEDQKNMLTAQKEAIPELDVQREQSADYYAVSEEDVLVAKADRNVAKRVDQRRMENQQDKDQRLAAVKAEQEAEAREALESGNGENRNKNLDSKSDSRQAVQEAQAQMSGMITAGPSDDYEDRNKLIHPEIMQQQAEVKMDFNSEQNQTILDQRKEDAAREGTEEIQEMDNFDLENMQGADVLNAEDQAKIEEARVRDLARNAAVDAVRDAIEEDKHSEQADVKKLSRSEQAQLEDDMITAEPVSDPEMGL